MKILTSMAAGMLTVTLLCAQSEVNFTQFMHNKLAINPGYAGAKEALTFTGLYRHQWTSIEGAPRTASFNVNMPFFNNRCGAGLSVISDRIGLFTTNYVELSYAYRIKLKGSSVLSLGLQGRIEQARTDWGKADPLDMGDEQIPMEQSKRFNPNFGWGAYFQNESFFAGFSMPTLLKTTQYKDVGNELSEVRSMTSTYFMAGLVQRISRNIYFRPSVMATMNENAPFDLDINASFLLMEKLWLGASYRLGDSMDGIVQYQINKQFKAGVAVDFTVSDLNNYTGNSYELLLEYRMIYDNEEINNIRFF